MKRMSGAKGSIVQPCSNAVVKRYYVKLHVSICICKDGKVELLCACIAVRNEQHYYISIGRYYDRKYRVFIEMYRDQAKYATFMTSPGPL